MQNILVIEDELSIRNLIKLHLENSGYIITDVNTGADGIHKVSNDIFDAVLLDLGLPDAHGTQVLESIRKISEVPVIIMTVQSDEKTKVQVLDAGADDYLVKPFGLEELKARVRAALRRANSNPAQDVYENGPLAIHYQQRKVYVNDTEVKLTSKEFDFLKILTLQSGCLVTRTQVLQRIWGKHSEDKGHYLRIYISQIRKKLGIKGLITTEPGVGYRINFLK